ncbi:MFS transporter [Planococcus shenhongbingii]|uniref:MFS transporter n=1 Tax=Planococcus shenhongbingii TaxID=3058398 RepID=UPI00261F1D6D|nr:MFS transporter [Planococcus sp. N016]WKA59250.1 MFS transporter [Planococcus sp. N016]
MKHNNLNNAGISKKAWLVIALLFVVTVISNADKAIIGFASVPLMEELGLTAAQWGMVGGVFFLLYSISAILGGVLADRIGVRAVMAGMVALWSIVQFSTIFVNSFAFLLATRIILGAGEGPSYSLAMTAASKWLPKEKLGIGMTLVSIGGPLGVAISAPMLVHLILNYGWRSAFIATGIIGIVWIFFWLGIVKSKDEKMAEPAARKTAATDSRPETKFSSVLKSKNFILIALCGFATYWSFTIGLNWLPNYLENVRRLESEVLTIVVALPWVLITLTQLFFSTLSDRLYRKTQDIVKGRIFVLGPVMVAGALSYFFGAMAQSNFIAIALLSLGLALGCITLVLGPVILVNLVSKEHQGKIQGWFMAVTSLGGIVGPYITGLLVENASSVSMGFQLAFQSSGLVILIFGGLVWAAVRPNKLQGPTPIRLPEEVQG